jgi:essential nuclear protein 1
MSMKSRPGKEAVKAIRHNPLPDKRAGGGSNNKHHRKLHGRGGPSAQPAGKRGKQAESDEDEEDGDIDVTEGMPDRSMKGVRFEEDDEEGDDFDDEDDNQAVDSRFVYDHDFSGRYEDAGEQEDENEDELYAEDDTAMQFLSSNRQQSLSLADIILEKLREKEAMKQAEAREQSEGPAKDAFSSSALPPKVVEVYTAVGELLQHYRSGKIPKALKMLPHLKGWERILWLTRPDMWSPAGTYAVTRIFASNLHVKMAQRFYNLVLLEKCRDDIQLNGKLNYHLYMSLKKALFKPAAFFKGILLPLAQSGDCTLREAAILGSVLVKVSVPAIHSAAALLRLTEMPYTGAISVLMRIMLQKKYALPLRVIHALCEHFCHFSSEARALPVIWHVALLTFVQRYKFEFTEEEVEQILALLRVKGHPQIMLEIRRELSTRRNHSHV